MAQLTTTTREERGKAIAKLSNQIQRVDESLYTVKSQSGNGEYQEVAESKDKHDTRVLFSKSKYLMGKAPKTLITDGLMSYSNARQKVYPETNHIREIRLTGIIHNNKMERMNGEVRDREKVMRGLKTKDTAVLKGYQIFHNYLRPHEGLDGKTPSEACGITIEGKNKWKTLIQNAASTNCRKR
jgi:putative transposase